MNVDDEVKKVIWSLQNNVRSEDERNVFKPTGKKPRSNNWKYIVVVLIGLFSISYLMTQFQKEIISVCLTSDFCFNSEEDKLLYIVYVFITNAILVFGIYFAYRVGKWLANKMIQ